MYRTRLFFGRISSLTSEILDNLLNVCYSDACNYFLIGFEGCSKHHFHIHFLIHFKNPKHLKALQKDVGIEFHNDYPVKDVQAAIEYCKGWKKDVKTGEMALKCSDCSYWDEQDEKRLRKVNFYVELGKAPLHGIKKDDQSQLVINALLEGKTPDEIRILFPRYYLHHSRKVKEFYTEQQKNLEPNKKRIIRLVYSPDMFKVLDAIKDRDSIFPAGSDISTYRNQKHVFMDFCFAAPDYWLSWCMGYPLDIRRGFEVITIDPDYVYLIISNVKYLREIQKIYPEDKLSYHYIEYLF